ncbi:Prefoldin subunit-domain-containing protein [Aspergillus egyptiacus]|nr:Prefoldin subunit-domain-containing protein [Aspergillus egyptiacus]
MGVPDNSLDDLERQRLELENNILKLQQSLYHWRTWEAEYDGLKEEIIKLDEDATVDDFLGVAHDFGGTLVNEDEIRVIIGEKQGLKRTRQQVTDLISRRIDYVRENVSLMEKRLHAAENQLGALDFVEQPPAEPTADFPMQEIVEELDENGEIISSKTMTPGEQAADLLDILKKAGVKDIPDAPNSNESTADTPATQPSSNSTSGNDAIEVKEQPKGQTLDNLADKSLGTLPESDGVSTSLRTGSDPVSSADSKREIPITNVDESPEDAELRREMIRYGLDEVGAVVAELELDEDGSEVSVDEYDLYEDGEDDEEEDEYGRSLRPVLDEDYHRQMRELEAKLNARGMWNMGKDVASLPENMKEDLEQAGKVKIQRSQESDTEPVPKTKPKKKVAFAEDVDIAPAPKPPVNENRKAISRETDVPVLSDSIFERTKPVDNGLAANTAPTPKKASRFKSARGLAGNIVDSATQSNGDAQSTKPPRKPTVPTPSSSLSLFPAKPSEPKPFSEPISDIAETPSTSAKPGGKILADTLVERDINEGTARAPEPDELDEELHRKEIATEFYRMRNKMARKEANTLDEEPEMVPVEPEEPPQRISRFRAARMG